MTATSVIGVHAVIAGTRESMPYPDVPLKESDTLLIAGLDADLKKLASEK